MGIESKHYEGDGEINGPRDIEWMRFEQISDKMINHQEKEKKLLKFELNSIIFMIEFVLLLVVFSILGYLISIVFGAIYLGVS